MVYGLTTIKSTLICKVPPISILTVFLFSIQCSSFLDNISWFVVESYICLSDEQTNFIYYRYFFPKMKKIDFEHGINNLSARIYQELCLCWMCRIVKHATKHISGKVYAVLMGQLFCSYSMLVKKQMFRVGSGYMPKCFSPQKQVLYLMQPTFFSNNDICIP